jgi:histidinol phosphatase-like PHP family hydrolase
MTSPSSTQPAFPLTDWHVHAAFYRLVDPKESARIEPMVEEGARLGLEMMGVGEHVTSSPKHPVSCFLDLARDLTRATLPIPTFLGAEVDVVDEHGQLSLPEGLRERAGLDYVISSVHGIGEFDSLGQYLDRYQRYMMGAVTADNGADILGHPWHSGKRLVAEGMVAEWRFELIPQTMLAELVDALATHGMALEVNCRSLEDFEDPTYRAFVGGVRERGIRVSVGSDAHTPDRLQMAVPINRFLAEIGFTRDEIWVPDRAR